MKSIFFHLMPYRDLPDDFEQRYESVWVTPPNSELCDPKMVASTTSGDLDQLELADRLGFDGIGINEHHQNAYGFMASPNLMAAALARRTPNNSAILVLGNTLALYTPRRCVWPRSSPCSTASRTAVWPPASRSARRWTSTAATASRPPRRAPASSRPHDLIMKAWTQAGPVLLQRPLQPAALR